MTDSGTTVWPNDIVRDPRQLSRDSPHKLVCFLLCPFEPTERWDQIFEFVKALCQQITNREGVNIECRRVDKLVEAKAIHDDIWRHIAAADFLIFDVTGLNSNVMFEFGVAATLRRPGQVILIKDADDSSQLPFNAFAQRYLPYRRKIAGDTVFADNLYKAIIHAITPAPYVPESLSPTSSGGFVLDFKNGDHPDLILSPGILHRRVVNGLLEFGSFYIFRNSWLQVTSADYRYVQIRVSFRFGEVIGHPTAPPFFGISLRNQSYYANYGYLAMVRGNGKVARTWPKDDRGDYGEDDFAVLSDFDYSKKQFVDLTVSFTDECLRINAKMEGNSKPVETKVAVKDLPYAYTAGKVLLQTSLCRAQIRGIEFRPL